MADANAKAGVILKDQDVVIDTGYHGHLGNTVFMQHVDSLLETQPHIKREDGDETNDRNREKISASARCFGQF